MQNMLDIIKVHAKCYRLAYSYYRFQRLSFLEKPDEQNLHLQS